MLDIKYIRENVEALRRGLDKDIRPLQMEWETLQSERNALSKTIGAAAPIVLDRALRSDCSVSHSIWSGRMSLSRPRRSASTFSRMYLMSSMRFSELLRTGELSQFVLLS